MDVRGNVMEFGKKFFGSLGDAAEITA